jgi:dTDP-4-amino-4,6-dideoxygalactose transaminase
MKIKFQDQFLLHNPIKRKLFERFLKIIKSSNFILGKEVAIFEKKFAQYTNTKYAIAVSNGTDALILALKSLNLNNKDEVIIPAMTYFATALAVLHNNLKLVLCDIDKNTGLLDLEQLKKKITKKTKCIIPVNFNGNYIEFHKLKKITPKNVKIIYDSSQSHGAFDCGLCQNKNSKYCCRKGPRVNEKAFISCYSLYPGKNLGALGDAGIITTNSIKICNIIINLRNIGSNKKYIHSKLGFNNRMDTVQASFLCEKLKKLDSQNISRTRNAKFFNNNLKNKYFTIVKHKKGSVYHNYVLLTKYRKKFMLYLKKSKIDFNMHYPFSINKHSAIKKMFVKKKFLNAEQYSKECISIPIHPFLKKKHLKYIVKKINNFEI